MKRKGWTQVIVGLVLAMSFSASVMAQQPTQPNQGRGQQPGGFGQGQPGQFNAQNLDPAEIQRTIRQTRSDMIRESLGSTEEEWVILGPKIEKINGLVVDAGAGISSMANMFGRARGGARGGRGGALGGLNLNTLMGGSSGMAQRMDDLQAAIDNPAMPESEIKTRLAAVRAEREKVRQELAKARAELVQLLTQRQEAVLFTMGVLE